MGRRSVTQKEIAQQVGVSIATVSRALNDQPGVSPELRARILEAARDMGYSPNASARSLVTARTHCIGYIGYRYGFVLPPDLRSCNVASRVLEGIDEELSRHGYHMLATYVDQEAMKGTSTPNAVLQGRVDGLIMDGPALYPRFILQLRSMGFPIVLVDNMLSETPIDCILCDNEGGAYQAVKHLIDRHQHRHIIFLSGPAEWFSSRERAAGYRRALEEAGLEPRIVFMSNTVVETGRQAMLTALEEYPDLTAVMAVNDATAIGAIQACRQMGRVVPDDVAVVGFDDEPWAQIHSPPLTTVRIFWHEMGAQAARRVVDLIERPHSAPVRISLATELVVRGSCGCSKENYSL